MTLRACLQCRRHFGAEPACPFCGAIAPAPQPRSFVVGHFSRAAIFAGLAGCYTSNPPPQYGPPPPPPPPPVDTQQQTQTQQTQQFADPPPDTKPVTGTSRIVGTVTDSQHGTPMVQLQVQLEVQGAPVQTAPRTTRTDPQGRYSFDGLVPGTYIVKFGYSNHPRRAPPQLVVQLGDRAVKTADFQLYTPPPSNQPMPYGAPPLRRRIV